MKAGSPVIPLIPVTVVCRVSVDIACSPERLWQTIESRYAQGEKFSGSGYTIERFEDAAAYLGAYRMALSKDGVIVDDRIVRVSEIDEAARRISLHGQYLSESSHGLDVYASYQALPIATGARFAIDCHAHYSRWPQPSEDPAELRAAIEDMKATSAAGLEQFMTRVKAELEEAQR